MANSWIIPDFGDLGVSGNGSKGGPSQFSTCVRGRKPTGSFPKGSHTQNRMPHTNPNNRKRAIIDNIGSKKLKTNISSSTGNMASERNLQSLWIDKYQPSTKEELSVHKRKVTEVQTWIEEFYKNHKSPVLVLTGQTGGGKSTTVKVLANEMKIDLHHWEGSNGTSQFSADQDNTDYESQARVFENFIIRSSRYGGVADFHGHSNDEISADDERKSVIVLIEDFPNFCFTEPRKFHAMLKRCIQYSRAALIFVVTENFAGDTNMRTLFPPAVQQSLGVTVLKFNPVTVKALRDCLKNIVSKELPKTSNRSSIPEKKLDEIVQSCNGDLRGAITALQFLVECDDRKHCARNVSSAKITISASERDQSLLLFRAIGRVFYVKRNENEPADDFGLPPRLQSEARRPLTYVPEEIIDKCAANIDMLTSFLHENFPFFITNLTDYQRAAETMSVSDHIISEWSAYSSTQPCAASVAVRGLMHLTTGANSGKATFRKFSKPSAIETRSKIQQRLTDGLRITRDLTRRLRSVVTPIFTDLIPFCGRIVPLHNPTEANRYLQEMIKFSGYSTNTSHLREDESMKTEIDLGNLSLGTAVSERNEEADNTDVDLNRDLDDGLDNTPVIIEEYEDEGW